MKPYYTVVIPWVEEEFRTKWHPSTRDWLSLTRGKFDTVPSAIRWAKAMLEGTPYSIKKIED